MRPRSHGDGGEPAANPGKPALLRVLNDRAALSLLLDFGPLARNDIADRTGLSKPTAGEIIRRLELAGLIQESGTAESGRRGPNAVLYEVTDRSLAVAVDVQYVDIRSVVVDARGRDYPVAVHRMTGEQAAGDAREILAAAVARAAAEAGIEPGNVAEICVGVQAAVDHARDAIAFADGYEGWPRVGVAETLSRELATNVTLENDANLAALAERAEGAGAGRESFALLWLAEGVGLALDIDGALHRGARGAAGEIGYLNPPAGVAVNGTELPDISDLVSSDAIATLGGEHGLVEPGADWRRVLEALSAIDPDHPFLTALAERIAYTAMPAMAVADPEAVVLHGPTGVAGGAALAEAVTAWLRADGRWSTPFVAPALADGAVLRGARRLLIGRLRAALAGGVPDSTDAPEPSRMPMPAVTTRSDL
jgi:predicted NBD/HSP70 family sugar kinase